MVSCAEETLTGCLNNLIEIFEKHGDLLEKQQWFPEEPTSTRWWGGLETPLEVMVTAVLVKLSRWSSALRALERMRAERLLDVEKLASIDPEELSVVIKGVGFSTSKAVTIVELARYILANGGVTHIAKKDLELLRRELMDIEGIGRETADSILLFALHKPVFPLARLSARVLKRFCGQELGGYEKVRRHVEVILSQDLYKLKLLHAGLVTIASKYCRERDPRCNDCILRSRCSYNNMIIERAHISSGLHTSR
ncbi:MAG: hypothetical protein RQ885_14525 [Desulfurococcales archaeon]|nr:hypothetical protein [Desulfurococcales archaeon]